MRLNLLKTTACVMAISAVLGTVGCATRDYDDFGSNIEAYEETPQQMTRAVESQQNCADYNGDNCFVISETQSDLYIMKEAPEKTKNTHAFFGSDNGSDLAISVKNKTQAKPVEIAAPVAEPVKIVPVEPAPIEKQHAETTTEAKVKTVETQTVETKQVIEEETTTTSTLKDVSLSSQVSYGEKCHDWEAVSGDTLRDLLMKWGAQSGWSVIWKLDRDYHLEAGVIFRGTFTEVSSALIRSFARATPAPIGTFYKGNRVLVVTTQENENAN